VPKTPGAAGLERDRVGLEALVLGRLGARGAGSDPVELRTLADRQQHAVAGDRELRWPGAGSGRRRPDASGLAERIRMNSTPVTLPALSVITAVGPAWKIAVTPSSIAS
jgi:hypothetical protein